MIKFHHIIRSRWPLLRSEISSLAIFALSALLLLGMATQGSTAESGGVLRFGMRADPGSISPRIGNNVGAAVVRNVVENLLFLDPKTGKIEPWLARSWDVEEEGSVFIFRLRDDVTFSDGTKLTADVIKKNFDQIPGLPPTANSTKQLLTGYVGSEVIDDYTIKVKFGGPNVQFLEAVTEPRLGIISGPSVDKPVEEVMAGEYAGSGPFTIASYESNSMIKLVKRSGYSSHLAVDSNRGDAYLDGIDISILPESTIRTGSLFTGQLDYAADLPSQDAARFKNAGPDGPVLLARSIGGITGGFFLNAREGLLTDIAVRKALMVGIDRQAVSDDIFFGIAPPATAVLTRVTPGWTDMSAALAYDPSAAESMLEEDGWHLDAATGKRSKDGQELVLDSLWPPVLPWGKPVLELLQQQLAKIGVTLNVRQVSQAEFTSLLASNAFNLLLAYSTRPDPHILYGELSPDSPSSLHGLEDAELSNALDAQRAEADTDKRNALIKTAQERIIDIAAFIPIVDVISLSGVAGNVEGLEFDASNNPRFYDAWFKKS